MELNRKKFNEDFSFLLDYNTLKHTAYLTYHKNYKIPLDKNYNLLEDYMNRFYTCLSELCKVLSIEEYNHLKKQIPKHMDRLLPPILIQFTIFNILCIYSFESEEKITYPEFQKRLKEKEIYMDYLHKLKDQLPI